MNVLQGIVPASCVGLRLDQTIPFLFPDITRSEATRLIEAGQVLYERKIVKKREKMKEGASLEVRRVEMYPTTVEAEKMDFSVLYEDESLFVINKPPHLVVHPAHGHWTGTFAHGLVAHLQSIEGMDPMRPGIVHRLDKDTSGVLVAAKNQMALHMMARQFQARSVFKRYEAVLVGEMGETKVVTMPIGRDPVDRKKMAVLSTGKEAMSSFTPLYAKKGLTFASIEIKTGRTHQIRVHAAFLHHPVLGDSLYGSSASNKKWKIDRQLLHCAEIRLLHPVTSRSLSFIAPLPHDMGNILEQIRS